MKPCLFEKEIYDPIAFVVQALEGQVEALAGQVQALAGQVQALEGQILEGLSQDHTDEEQEDLLVETLDLDVEKDKQSVFM